jgi:hypothetical protein
MQGPLWAYYNHLVMVATKSSAVVMHFSTKNAVLLSSHVTMRSETNCVIPASKDLSPSAVCDEPNIHTCHNSEVKSDAENKENSVKLLFRKNHNEDHGDILIHGMWARGTDCIMCVQITFVDATSNRSKDRAKVLAAAHE